MIDHMAIEAAVRQERLRTLGNAIDIIWKMSGRKPVDPEKLVAELRERLAY